MSNKVRECIKRSLPGTIHLIYSNSYSKLCHKFGFKDKQPKSLKHNVVYRITCSCLRKYYGECCRPLKIRFNEHLKTTGSCVSEVAKHLASSPGCHITFDNCEVLTHEPNNFRRKPKESLYIQENDDGTLLNDNLKSVPLFLFNLPSRAEQTKGRIYTSF